MISPGRQIEKWQSASRFLVQKTRWFFFKGIMWLWCTFFPALKKGSENDILGQYPTCQLMVWVTRIKLYHPYSHIAGWKIGHVIHAFRQIIATFSWGHPNGSDLGNIPVCPDVLWKNDGCYPYVCIYMYIYFWPNCKRMWHSFAIATSRRCYQLRCLFHPAKKTSCLPGFFWAWSGFLGKLNRWNLKIIAVGKETNLQHHFGGSMLDVSLRGCRILKITHRF